MPASVSSVTDVSQLSMGVDIQCCADCMDGERTYAEERFYHYDMRNLGSLSGYIFGSIGGLYCSTMGRFVVYNIDVLAASASTRLLCICVLSLHVVLASTSRTSHNGTRLRYVAGQ